MEQDRGAPKKEKGKSLGQRWADMQPTKTVLFWSCLITAVVVMIIGFNWGGWMTGGAAQSMSDKSSAEAVVDRLAPICVTKFLQDPAKAAKLEEIKAMNSYSRGDYIVKQGWATMSGEEKPDRKVAVECAKLLMLIPEIVAEAETTVSSETTTSLPAEATPSTE
jgi:hypothetical protein